MKLINRLADRALERLAPAAKAEAASDCWYQSCGGNCIKYCCRSTGCSSICVCPA